MCLDNNTFQLICIISRQKFSVNKEILDKIWFYCDVIVKIEVILLIIL